MHKLVVDWNALTCTEASLLLTIDLFQTNYFMYVPPVSYASNNASHHLKYKDHTMYDNEDLKKDKCSMICFLKKRKMSYSLIS
jgi:hypothetical protein